MVLYIFTLSGVIEYLQKFMKVESKDGKKTLGANLAPCKMF